MKDTKSIKKRNFELEKALNYQNSKLFHRLGYSWELSPLGSYLKLNLSLRRVHTSTVKNIKNLKGNKDLEDLSVIREESTNRMATTEKAYEHIDEETTTIRTNRITAHDVKDIIHEEMDESLADSKYTESTKFEEETLETQDEEEKSNNDLKTRLKLNLGDVKQKQK